ncbi:hypothetical protein D9757_006722 [Collybiopsis confluens]|uniref:F-box domain-containing protein n=1 Tax=Collybiopsis confluens TaxID=2823264 RepID=A0A8H5M9C7_9AGAR|nr:hypothetical protein D9757_006722 [Collybiopsis confluens]
MSVSQCVQCGYCAGKDMPRIPLGSKRFQTLRTTNECLTDDEKRIFDDFTADGQSELAALDARITRVHKLLQDLKKGREELNAALTERQIILHPMRSLPDSLLVEVFKHGSGIYDDPEDLFRSEWHSLDVSSAPWVFGHVCRRWREMSINTAMLWTRVKITHLSVEDSGVKVVPVEKPVKKSPKSKNKSARTGLLSPPRGFPVLRTTFYIGRSGASPLQIYLDPIFSESQTPELGDQAQRRDDYKAIAPILLSQSWRWQSLHLRQADCLGTSFFYTNIFQLPSLKNLTTNGSHSKSATLIAPQLRSWTAMGESWRDDITIRSKIWEFSGFQLRYDVVLGILRRRHDVQRLRVQGLLDRDEPMPESLAPRLPLTTVLLNGLQELEIKPPATDGLSPFLELISCPSPQSLYVGTSELSGTTIRSFEQRSNFSLKHWEFNSLSFSVTGTLRNTGSIETIVARDVSTVFQNLILSELTVSAPSPTQNPSSDETTSSSDSSPSPLPIPCPNLRRLELHLGPPQDLPARYLNWDIVEQAYECVKSRMVAATQATESSSDKIIPSPLEVLFTAPDTQAENIRHHQRLAELRSCGLRVEIIGF